MVTTKTAATTTKKASAKKDPRPLRRYGWAENPYLKANIVTGSGYDLADAFERLPPARQKRAAAAYCVRELRVIVTPDVIKALRDLSERCAVGMLTPIISTILRHANDPGLREQLDRILGVRGVHVHAERSLRRGGGKYPAPRRRSR